jgi:hypothetical protein
MSIVDGVGKLIKKAKDEASEMAQSARLSLDLRQLEGRRDILYSKIGRRVYKKRDQIIEMAELKPIFADIEHIEAEIHAKEAELREVRGDGERPAAESQQPAPESGRPAAEHEGPPVG